LALEAQAEDAKRKELQRSSPALFVNPRSIVTAKTIAKKSAFDNCLDELEELKNIMKTIKVMDKAKEKEHREKYKNVVVPKVTNNASTISGNSTANQPAPAKQSTAMKTLHISHTSSLPTRSRKENVLPRDEMRRKAAQVREVARNPVTTTVTPVFASPFKTLQPRDVFMASSCPASPIRPTALNFLASTPIKKAMDYEGFGGDCDGDESILEISTILEDGEVTSDGETTMVVGESEADAFEKELKEANEYTFQSEGTTIMAREWPMDE
jgi:hypothetical protein